MNKEQLITIIERVEKQNEMIDNARADIKTIKTEAKSAGFDPKYIMQMVRLRKKDQDEIEEEDELTKMYRRELGI